MRVSCGSDRMRSASSRLACSTLLYGSPSRMLRLWITAAVPGGGGGRMRGAPFVPVPWGGNPGADVEERVAAVGGAHPYRPAQERPVGPHDVGQLRHRGDRLCGHRAVGREVVGTAEVAVVNPGRAGPVRIDPLRRLPGVGHAEPHSE